MLNTNHTPKILLEPTQCNTHNICPTFSGKKKRRTKKRNINRCGKHVVCFWTPRSFRKMTVVSMHYSCGWPPAIHLSFFHLRSQQYICFMAQIHKSKNNYTRVYNSQITGFHKKKCCQVLTPTSTAFASKISKIDATGPQRNDICTREVSCYCTALRYHHDSTLSSKCQQYKEGKGLGLQQRKNNKKCEGLAIYHFFPLSLTPPSPFNLKETSTPQHRNLSVKQYTYNALKDNAIISFFSAKIETGEFCNWHLI